MDANKSIGDRVSFYWRNDPDRVYTGRVVTIREFTTHDRLEIQFEDHSAIWVDTRDVVEVNETRALLEPLVDLID